MSRDELDDLAWRIMIHNEEYADLDRVFAVNGILKEEFDELTEAEQDDIIKRLAIGIQAFNASLEDDLDKVKNWRRLPRVEVSGNEES
jgi:hypothetical protein